MTMEKPLTRWTCSDCGTVGMTTESVITAIHPKYNHHSSPSEICVLAGLRGLLADAEKEDKNIMLITSLRNRIQALS